MTENASTREVKWIIRRPDGQGGSLGLVGYIKIGIDINRLREACSALANQVPWTEGWTHQIALQCRLGSKNLWHDACRNDISQDHLYAAINPELKGSYFEEVLNSIPFQPCRARLMAMTRGSCYSVHRDLAERFHIAVETSPHALFIFPHHNEVFHVPEDGNLYFLNTLEEHTALNGDDRPRIHLVLSAATRPTFSSNG